MDFKVAVQTCFSKYVTFTGRARRSEFWWFVLFIVVGNVIASLLDSLLFGWMTSGHTVSILGALFGLAVFLPSIAAGVRRLHDLDRTGWWYLLVLIPVIGTLILIFFFVQKGTDGANRYGPDPVSGSGVPA
ncbi:DUF805 domain-containing protein [Roseivivax sediminis]|uniref:Uncharacterized membrane protein YhaH, DUF805 family n=1 Tax=Roseivivax sediminis TaxID=936889 RepID=A0A1I2C0K6_9RHOB|nr:DUF805 domain-containing protein [Roseivivax sediminis]SFE61877.1 Uncharacterized membrane protein YhaH, DUF805 family [Roseivivax sediminis]